jgi:prolyl-tRNA synthetase
MRQSQFFLKTTKDVSQQDVSINAQLLVRGGFVNQLMAGVYSYLPLGLRVLTKIENIIRQEMNKVSGQEILMPALQPREIWDKTQRWDAVDVLFKLKGAGDRDLALGPTHEEVVTPLGATFLHSYKDLPRSVYQVQTKFRNEARAKSGLLRGREFRMKDMYSFHATQECLDKYYDQVIEAYHSVYRRVGLGDTTVLTFASGGMFSKYSHEFQTITDSGEDIIYKVPNTKIAINKEIIDDQEALSGIVPNYKKGDEKNFKSVKAIEVGNIFKLGTRFSNSCDALYTDAEGKNHAMIMGCYGIGPSRIMGTIAETLSDKSGLIWPEEVAPFDVHLISLAQSDDEIAKVEEVYQALQAANLDVLYDDRKDLRAGGKLADADLIGIPHRVLVSKKTIEAGVVEWKKRTDEQAVQLPLAELIQKLKSR